jgi:hypothetical protein
VTERGQQLRGRRPSATAEYRRTLLEEGGHAVDVVLGIALQLLQRGLELELVGHGSSGRVVDESLEVAVSVSVEHLRAVELHPRETIVDSVANVLEP